MDTIEAVGRFRFAPEQRAAVMRAIEDSKRIVRDKNEGTLADEWLISDSATEAPVREKYASSEALMAHAGKLADVFAGTARTAAGNAGARLPAVAAGE